MADLTPANDIGPDSQTAGRKRLKLRKTLLKLTVFLTVLGPMIFVIGALGAKMGLWSWMFGLSTLSLKVGPLVLFVGVITALLALLAAIFIKPRKGIVVAVIGLLVPLLGMGKLAHTKSTVEKLPFIHDVSTDTQTPPEFGKVIMSEREAVDGVNSADYTGKTAPAKAVDGTPTKELVSALQTKAYPDIRPLVLTEGQDVVFGEALATAKAMGWEIKEENLETGRIDATHTTFWYGFEDDITIRLRASEGGGTIIDVRSLSRVGGSDLGKNAARIRAFLDRLGS